MLSPYSWEGHKIISANMICLIVTIEMLYYLYKKVQWNFSHGYALRQGKALPIIIRMTVFTVTMLYVSKKIQIISVSIIFLFLICLSQYIEHKNLKINKNNCDLFHFYLLETEDFKKCIYVGAIISYIATIFNYVFN